MKKNIIILLLMSLLFPVEHVCGEEMEKYPQLSLRILETTDLHSHILDFDYVNKRRTIEFGLSRTASLIQQARKDQLNTLLFDVGDVIKGNALADYVASSNVLYYTDIHPAYKSMNLLKYDAATIGNHEFNYGIDFLLKSIQGADFPFVNANIYVDDQNNYDQDDIHFFSPYIILNKNIMTNNGKEMLLKVGVIGLITPITAQWDKEHLENKVKIKNMQETAEEIVPKMKKEGADIIIALVHAGLHSDNDLKEKKGNNVKDVSKVNGIDVILYGHSHSLFPKKGERSSLQVQHHTGKINGKPAVQAGFWGNHLGIIDLTLEKKAGKWSILESKSTAKPIIRIIKEKKVPIVSPYQPIEYMMSQYHRDTIDFLKKNIMKQP
ncbi:metallophosphoesterase [Niallia sp. 03133]|uniref:metallophosphoesterase n=1 Tax=Niallia sp. 03133 TaxID=3458060 RepID=UPI004043C516